ncbi:MAG: hypothetical protein H6850_03040 [Alphaproteobacteria bacterium]|nr:MAG: hypothetical protein H6850_03040 [Alphaproteobacteria bacterium]
MQEQEEVLTAIVVQKGFEAVDAIKGMIGDVGDNIQCPFTRRYFYRTHKKRRGVRAIFKYYERCIFWWV